MFTVDLEKRKVLSSWVGLRIKTMNTQTIFPCVSIISSLSRFLRLLDIQLLNQNSKFSISLCVCVCAGLERRGSRTLLGLTKATKLPWNIIFFYSFYRESKGFLCSLEINCPLAFFFYYTYISSWFRSSQWWTLSYLLFFLIQSLFEIKCWESVIKSPTDLPWWTWARSPCSSSSTLLHHSWSELSLNNWGLLKFVPDVTILKFLGLCLEAAWRPMSFWCFLDVFLESMVKKSGYWSPEKRGWKTGGPFSELHSLHFGILS